MCGIYGYVGKKRARAYCLKGLSLLEYRGYDSSGIATIDRKRITCVKSEGKVAMLEEALEKVGNDRTIGIAHTRWATHGKPTEQNAHPHYDEEKSVAVVHNGIIENYTALYQKLGETPRSETDTEVIARLFAHHYNGDLLATGAKVLSELEGAYAIAVIHRDHPDEIFVAAKECPLAVAQGVEEAFISSDPNAFFAKELRVLYLATGEYGIVTPSQMQLYTKEGPVERLAELLDLAEREISKKGHDHFMHKEIYEQPVTVQQALSNRLDEEYGTARFPELATLQSVQRILILACGTSWHAGLVGRSLFEELARIPTEVEIASEFRYTNPLISEGTLVLAISQSGETADTLAALREAKAKGAKVLGLCNVPNSTLTREADHTLFLDAGPEISVCSTKAFTSQLTLLTLLATHLGRLHHLDKREGQDLIAGLKHFPHDIRKVLAQEPHIAALAHRFASYTDFFFLGRRYMYPTSLEAALKLKEISYINANGYAAGEMKHGPIALASPELAVVAMCGNEHTFEKIVSNIQEIKARGSPVIAFAPRPVPGADHVIEMPPIRDELAPIPYSVAGQLLAYHIARARDCDIDKPRNLAKSVTVE